MSLAVLVEPTNVYTTRTRPNAWSTNRQISVAGAEPSDILWPNVNFSVATLVEAQMGFSMDGALPNRGVLVFTSLPIVLYGRAFIIGVLSAFLLE